MPPRTLDKTERRRDCHTCKSDTACLSCRRSVPRTVTQTNNFETLFCDTYNYIDRFATVPVRKCCSGGPQLNSVGLLLHNGLKQNSTVGWRHFRSAETIGKLNCGGAYYRGN